MSAVGTLQAWFDKLSHNEKKEVVRFLYGGPALLQEGYYCGPAPGLVEKGLHCGPAPSLSAQSNKCPHCGK